MFPKLDKVTSRFKLSLLFETFPEKYKKSSLRTFEILPTLEIQKWRKGIILETFGFLQSQKGET